MVRFVSCFWAQSERLFQQWMTARSPVRLQIVRENFPATEDPAIIL
jgi:hypothetical protein